MEDLGQARLVAQRLAWLKAPTPAEAAQWLTAMQARDYSGALTSVGLRTRARLRAEVVAALDTGEIVRSWLMRGTPHMTVAQDLALDASPARATGDQQIRRPLHGLGLDQPQLEQACELSIDTTQAQVGHPQRGVPAKCGPADSVLAHLTPGAS